MRDECRFRLYPPSHPATSHGRWTGRIVWWRPRDPLVLFGFGAVFHHGSSRFAVGAGPNAPRNLRSRAPTPLSPPKKQPMAGRIPIPTTLPYDEFMLEMKRRLTHLRNPQHLSAREMMDIFDFVQLHGHHIRQHPKLEKTIQNKLRYLARQNDTLLRKKCCQYWCVLFSAATLPCGFLVGSG